MTKQSPDNDSWRTWPLEQLEREYSPSSCVPSIAPFLDSYVERSREAAERFPHRRNLKWGGGDHEVFDFFPAASTGAPLLVFFHGGYWQEHSKDDVLFVAAGCVPNGIACAVVEYTLAPAMTVSGIVDQCRRAIRAIWSQSKNLGFDSHRLFVAGSSAGAHLASMMLLRGWQNDLADGADLIVGAILLSGIYDLAPLIPTYINQALHLNEGEAAKLSPLYQPPGRPVPVVVAWGDNETSEFKRQSQNFASKLRDANFPVTALEVPGTNHFDIVFEIADRTSQLGRANLALIDGETHT
ncbi:MAG TPA: alpha/beta hydrolase [Candidatus Acidoferrales bacterium]